MSQKAKIILLIGAIVALIVSAILAFYSCRTLPEGVGFVASIATLFALLYTLFEVWTTASVANATKDAVDGAVKQLRGNDYRLALALAIRHVSEIEVQIKTLQWKIASIRAHDLADQCMRLAYIRPGVDDDWLTFSENVRYFELRFGEGGTGRSLEYDSRKWREVSDSLLKKLHKEHQPFDNP